MLNDVYVRLPVFTPQTNMDDAIEEPKRKNCTFLFKKRKIRSNATRKRKEADGSDGESLISDRFNVHPDNSRLLSEKTEVFRLCQKMAYG